MGIFSDLCPECGASVRRAAKFCSACGKPGPRSWAKCPACGKWVGGESRYCWHCRKPLNPELRGMTSGGIWQRPAGVFAQRFEVPQLHDLLTRGVTVETGTVAVLLDEGAFKGVLPPGHHSLLTLKERLPLWGKTLPRTVILVDGGDVALPLRVEALRTAEGLPVDFYGEVAFAFLPEQAEPFVANLIKAQPTVSYEALSFLLETDVRFVAENLAGTSTMDDLIRDPTRRLRFEDALRETLGASLERVGLQLVRVASAEFSGAEYEKLRQKMGEVDLKRRELEFDQRLRELLQSDEMKKLGSEQEMEAYVQQLAFDKGVAAESRTHQLALMQQVQRHEIEAKEVAYTFGQEMDRVGHEINLKIRWDDYDAERTVKAAEITDRVHDIKRAAEGKDVEQALGWREKKLALERQDEAERKRVAREDLGERVRIFEGVKLETMLATIDDPARREQLLELYHQTQMSGRSAQEILALAATRSPAAAQALTEMLQRTRAQVEAEYAEHKKLSVDAMERLESTMKAALASMAAASRQGDVHVIR